METACAVGGCAPIEKRQPWLPRCAACILYSSTTGATVALRVSSERAVLADALALYDWISAQPGVDPHRVGLIGRSLGSGVAAYVASEWPAAAVVLITPYDSIVEIARRRFPYCAAPVLLKHRFDALGFARRARAPALMLLAEVDTVIPQHHALHLIEAWAGKKEVVLIQNTNHCDVQEHVHSWQAIADFVTQQLDLQKPQ